jgi:hypothetical protein
MEDPMPKNPKAPDKAPDKEELDRELDDALEATFPASDPLAVGETTATEPDRPLLRRPAELDLALVEELARNVEKTHPSDK